VEDTVPDLFGRQPLAKSFSTVCHVADERDALKR